MKNRIKEYREKAGLSQKALADLVEVSPQIIRRIEVGQQKPTTERAQLIADALDQHLYVIFPELDVRNEAEKRRGFDPAGLVPRCRIGIQLRGAVTLEYPLDALESAMVASKILGVSEYLRFESLGRAIYLRREDIQYIHLIEDRLRPAPKASVYDVLNESFGDVRLFFRGRTEPTTVDAVNLDRDELSQVFATLDSDSLSARVLSLTDEDGDGVYLRLSELVLAEVPTPSLLDAMNEWDQRFM